MLQRSSCLSWSGRFADSVKTQQETVFLVQIRDTHFEEDLSPFCFLAQQKHFETSENPKKITLS